MDAVHRAQSVAVGGVLAVFRGEVCQVTPALHAIEDDLREWTAFRASCDPPDREAYARFMARLDAVREQSPRADVWRVETLIEKLTGVKR